ncbi:MAG: outer membrane lipoprotein carrier protein LolA [Pseudomonadota bacterium]
MKKLLFVLCLMASPAFAERLSLNAISGYLNGLQTAQGDFTQVNPDGTIDQGRIFIKRPGRIRFEYNAPNESLVIAGGGQVAVFDPKSDGEATRFPLNQTPLSIILERNVNLGQRDMVVGHDSDGTRTLVTAQDPRRPEYGYIQMIFTANPIQLRQWVVSDEANAQTTVILRDLTEGGSISNRQFNIIAEMDARR